MTSSIDRRTFLAAITASVSTVANAAGQDSQTIMRLMRSLVAAERRYDKVAVSRLLDDAFIYVGNDGSLTDRAEFIRLTDKLVNPLDVLDVTDTEVHVRGDTAIATGLIHEKGTLDGRNYEFKGRTLTIFSPTEGQMDVRGDTRLTGSYREINVNATSVCSWPVSDRRLKPTRRRSLRDSNLSDINDRFRVAEIITPAPQGLGFCANPTNCDTTTAV